MATTTTIPTGNARTIAGLMAIAVVFSVIGAEIRIVNPAKGASANLPKAFSEPFLIIAGGTFATVLLSLIAEAGEAGRQFAVGLAGLATVTALLVNGGPVWSAADTFLGAKATGSTSPTAPTASTTSSTTTKAST